MKAVILAAGEGTRLEPLTNVRPKPMLPVANKPLLEYVIESLKEAGINDLVLVVGYESERIQNYFGDGDAWNVDISYVFQSPQLGTGHAISQAKSVVGSPFLVLNGDRIVNPDAIQCVIATFNQHETTTIAITPVEEPARYGVVETQDNNQITKIQEKPHPDTVTSDYINAGIYAFDQDIFAALEQTEYRGELTITDTINQHTKSLHPIAVPFTGHWLDVSRPWDLLRVNGEMLDQQKQTIPEATSIANSAAIATNTTIASGATIAENATIDHGTAIGPNVTIGANTVLDNTIVFADATIEPGSVLRDTIIGQNVTLGPGSIIEGGKADVYLNETLHQNVPFGGILGDNATVGANVTITPGTRLGNEATVASGCLLDGTIPPGTNIHCR